VYENGIIKRYLAGVFLVVLGAGIIGGSIYFFHELVLGPLWVSIGLGLGRFGFFIGGDLGKSYENKGFSLNHTCGRHISSTTAWECGYHPDSCSFVR
jgi:hypothetical protein